MVDSSSGRLADIRLRAYEYFADKTEHLTHVCNLVRITHDEFRDGGSVGACSYVIVDDSGAPSMLKACSIRTRCDPDPEYTEAADDRADLLTELDHVSAERDSLAEQIQRTRERAADAERTADELREAAKDRDLYREALTRVQARSTAQLDEIRALRSVLQRRLNEHFEVGLSSSFLRVIVDLIKERYRADIKHGTVDQFLGTPDGTGGPNERMREVLAKAECDKAWKEGRGTWAHIAEEEAAETAAAGVPADIRREAIQAAGVYLKWAEAIDLRGAGK